MQRSLEDIASEVLKMNVESRAALAKRLLDSLDELTPEENERLWVEEAARRYTQLKAGSASPTRVVGVLPDPLFTAEYIRRNEGTAQNVAEACPAMLKFARELQAK